jgi:hypothetical protein
MKAIAALANGPLERLARFDVVLDASAAPKAGGRFALRIAVGS